MSATYKRAATPQRSGISELFIDIETRSRQDLKKVTPYRYVEDPDFAIIMAQWAVDDGPVQVVTTAADIQAIPGLWDPTVRKVAHNAQFERICFSRFDRLPVGRYLHPEQWHDTMAIAGELGYPQGLGALATALGAEDKDTAGTALINWFCKPDPRTGEFRRPEDHPEKWAAFIEYGRQDVATLRDVHRKLGGWPTESERLLYMADQRINDRGMAIDMDLARAASAQVEENNQADLEKVAAITGLANPNSRDQLLGWLQQRVSSEALDYDLGDNDAVPFGPVVDLTADTVEKLLDGPLPADVGEVLQLRQNIALAASKKFPAAVVAANSDGRLRGGFRFFGAHTGRWTGRGVQPHNLTRAQFTKPDPETGKPVWDGDAEEAAILDLKLGLGLDTPDLKKLVRPLFTGPFTVVDYAAIEARVISWLADERWALEAFELGRDIYVETASRMGEGLTRSQGKVAVLALGYNGGINSLKALAGNRAALEAIARPPGSTKDKVESFVDERGMSDSEIDANLQVIVDTWRRANPSIVRMWSEMETAFRTGGPVGELMYVERDGKDRAIRLPSGRAITYHGVQHRWVTDRYGRRKLQAFFKDPARGGNMVGTYGGRLSENVTQAVARDVLGEALIRLDMTPHRVVGHVHDEILVEGTSTVAEISKIMTSTPSWAKGLPIDGAGFTTARYRKD